MADDSSPEIPQDKTKSSSPKESFAETFERLRAKRKPKETPRNFFEETDAEQSTEQTPLPQQEMLFRAAAIKCAQIEEEIVRLLKLQDFNQLGTREDLYIDNFPSGNIMIKSYLEDIYGVGGKPAAVEFLDGIAEDKEQLGITTDRSLEIGIYTDELTREAFEEYARKNPKMAENASTIYYFTQDGEYRKISCMPTGVSADPNRKPLRGDPDPKAVVDYYLSEMTPGDFEIAGQALIMLKKRIDPSGISKEPSLS